MYPIRYFLNTATSLQSLLYQVDVYKLFVYKSQMITPRLCYFIYLLFQNNVYLLLNILNVLPL